LVDDRCASACENVAFSLRRHPRARLVGRQTVGAGRFTNVMRAHLPNSGIRVVVPSAVYELGSGRVFPEKMGLTPDVVVAPGEDALLAALPVD
jgi:C-terminal processing protease CtpA/Prc